MENLPVFNFNFRDRPIRVIEIDGEPWFVAADVCGALDISWKGSGNSGTLCQLDDDEKGVTSIDTLGGAQEMAIINEPGFYKLAFRSNKPEAKLLTRMVTHEVLPAIRRTGKYQIGKTNGRTPEEISAMRLKVLDEHPDWKLICSESSEGLNAYEIAVRTGMSKSSIYRKLQHMDRLGIEHGVYIRKPSATEKELLVAAGNRP